LPAIILLCEQPKITLNALIQGDLGPFSGPSIAFAHRRARRDVALERLQAELEVDALLLGCQRLDPLPSLPLVLERRELVLQRVSAAAAALALLLLRLLGARCRELVLDERHLLVDVGTLLHLLAQQAPHPPHLDAKPADQTLTCYLPKP
jgi:hypothetical protein